MARWEPGTRARLQAAALELYVTQGFEQTTVEEIARAVGLTERTFFRHFADKREVLFAGSSELEALFVDTVAAAPESASPMQAVAAALERASSWFVDRRTFARARQAVISSHSALTERELTKMARLATALAQALRERGVEEPAASLTAEAGVAVFRVAFERWTAPREKRPLDEIITEALGELRTITSE